MTHDAAALGTLHRVPHPPQCCGLVLSPTQSAPHGVGASAGQTASHLAPVGPIAQRGLIAAHALPQLPQSVAVSIERSHPLLSTASQSS